MKQILQLLMLTVPCSLNKFVPSVCEVCLQPSNGWTLTLVMMQIILFCLSNILFS
jgi:hypothetical protein